MNTSKQAIVHLAVLGEHRGICGRTDGLFTVGEGNCTCEDCLQINDIHGGAAFTHDDWSDN